MVNRQIIDKQMDRDNRYGRDRERYDRNQIDQIGRHTRGSGKTVQ